MVPHSRHHHIQQSANILGDRCVRWRWEWGTMAAAVGHLGHNVSTDVVGLLWVVPYVGICRVMYQAIGNAYPARWRWASPPALEPSAWQPLCQIGCYAALSRKGHHGGMMQGGGKIGGKRAGGDYSYNRWVSTSVNHGGRCCPTATMGPHSRLLSIQQSANILCDRTTLLKLENTIINNDYLLI
jgi:hypothetical protein